MEAGKKSLSGDASESLGGVRPIDDPLPWAPPDLSVPPAQTPEEAATDESAEERANIQTALVNLERDYQQTKAELEARLRVLNELEATRSAALYNKEATDPTITLPPAQTPEEAATDETTTATDEPKGISRWAKRLFGV
jgi:hypothetical protein